MRSMTGYGRGNVSRDGREMTAEIRAVNHRFLDVSMRLPQGLGFAEKPLRDKLSERLSRGHLDVTLAYLNTREDACRVEADERLAAGYMEALRGIATIAGIEEKLSLRDFLTLPKLITVTPAEESMDAVLSLAMEAAGKALDELLLMREREGEKLLGDLSGTLDEVEARLAEAEKIAASMPEKTLERVRKRISEMRLEGVDDTRLYQEAAFLCDRCSVDEELTRLHSHIAQTRAALAQSEPAGRRLDFLVQEMNREVNTTASKSADAALSALTVDMKSLLEKMREQIQNVE